MSRRTRPENRVLTKDADTGPEASSKDFANAEISASSFELPLRLCLSLDGFPSGELVVTAVAVITSHVIELESRAGVLEMIVCNTRDEKPARQERCRCGWIKRVCGA